MSEARSAASVDYEAALRAAGMKVTAQRLAVLRAVAERPHRTADDLDKVVRAELGAISRQAVYDALAGADRARAAAADPARGIPGALRGPRRRQPPPPHLPRVRPDRRRRLRRRRRPVPDRGRRRGLRDRRSRGHLLGPMPRVRRPHASRDNRDGGTDMPRGTTRRVTRARTRRSIPRRRRRHRPRTNQDWWPDQLDLPVLHQHSRQSGPMGVDYDYAAEFATLDLDALKRDVVEVMTTLAGLVAGRLRQLRPAVHPHDVARGGHVPHRATVGAAAARARSASRRSTAGPTTRTSTRRAGCCGRSSRSTAARSRGPT